MFRFFLTLLFFVSAICQATPAIEELFKYGSIGTDHDFALPVRLWKVMPKVCPDLLPKRGKKDYENFGFNFEKDYELPIGLSQSVREGSPRVGINCAACHTGTYRTSSRDAKQFGLGMPANSFSVTDYIEFLLKCAADDRFSIPRLKALVKLNITEVIMVPVMKIEAKKYLKQTQNYRDFQPEPGPGRDDTSNAYKAVFFGQTHFSPSEIAGNVDFMSIWNSRDRLNLNMRSHWDGSASTRIFRDVVAYLGVGGMIKPINELNVTHVEKVENWLLDLKPPQWPQSAGGAFAIDQQKATRGKEVFEQNCSECHGKKNNLGRWVHDEKKSLLGQVIPLTDVKTDPYRVWALTPKLTTDLLKYINALVPGEMIPTGGYMASLLDGIAFRAPYLHNGSVPSLATLLMRPDFRPQEFYRGCDILDAAEVGFLYKQEEVLTNCSEPAEYFFKFSTKTKDDKWIPGNSNQGHIFGTELAESDKISLLEYMKSL